MRPTVLMLSSQAAELSAFKETLAPWLNIYKLCLIEQSKDEENLQAELLRANFQGLVLPHASEQNEEEYVRRRTQRIAEEKAAFEVGGARNAIAAIGRQFARNS